MACTVVYKPLAMVVPGECLARDLFDDQGGVLLSAGTPLDSTSCRRLEGLHLEAVPVRGVDAEHREQARQQTVERSLDHLFRHWRCSPGMNHLRAVLADHRRESMSR